MLRHPIGACAWRNGPTIRLIGNFGSNTGMRRRRHHCRMRRYGKVGLPSSRPPPENELECFLRLLPLPKRPGRRAASPSTALPERGRGDNDKRLAASPNPAPRKIVTPVIDTDHGERLPAILLKLSARPVVVARGRDRSRPAEAWTR